MAVRVGNRAGQSGDLGGNRQASATSYEAEIGRVNELFPGC